VRRIQHDTIVTGDPLPWKIGMWGSARDLRLLRALERRFPTLKKFAADRRLTIAQGAELREINGPKKGFEHRAELIGKHTVLLDALKNARNVHSLPQSALRALGSDEVWLRVRGGKGGLDLNRPPHILVSAARTFAVYSDEFLVVPPRQIGIAGRPADADLLRVLALYLSSSFVRYHQFFLSPQEGIRGGRSTKDALLQVPIPFAGADTAALGPWVELHRDLVEKSEQRWSLLQRPPPLMADGALEDIDEKIAELQRSLDALSARALGLQAVEEWLVDDLVRVRLDLIDGKVGEDATGYPSAGQLGDYAHALRDSLDTYLDRGEHFRHAITIVHEPRAGVVQIDFRPSPVPHVPTIEAAETAVGRAMREVRLRIEQQRDQWLYFNRNLVAYLDGKIFLFKPMQRIRWTRSQALADADQIIADLVAARDAA
jgi:hypothetical protein